MKMAALRLLTFPENISSERMTNLLLTALKCFVALFCFYLLLPVDFFSQVGVGLDPSWQFSLHMAHEQGLTFGKDFIFTYGPLGFLSTRYPFESAWLPLLLSDCLLWTTIAYTLAITCSKSNSTTQLVGVIFAVFLMGGVFYFMDLVIAQLALFFFLLFRFQETRNSPLLAVAALFSYLMFYIKVNMGLAAIVAMSAFLAAQMLLTKHWRYFSAALAMYYACLFGTTLLVNVDVPAYFIASLHIANGYNEAMYISPGDYSRYLNAAVIVVLAFLVVCCFHLKTLLKNPLWLLQTVFLSGFLFLLFKQSFVRADGHTLIFSHYVSLLIGLLSLFVGGSFQSWLRRVFILALILSFPVAADRVTISYISSKVDAFSRYLHGVSESDNVIRQRIPRTPANYLPQELVTTIGAASVDIIPTEISYLYYHNLTYNPRPIMQSYSAYTSYLDRLNRDKYSSTSRPDFIIFSIGCVDGRYCFFDEAQTKLAMLENYSLVKRYNDKLLLKSLSNPRKVIRKQKSSGTITLGQRLPIADSDPLLYITIQPEFTLLGRLRAFLYQPAELRITFYLENGASHEYRAVKPILEGGVLINRYVSTNKAAALFFKNKHGKLPRVTSIKLHSAHSWAFDTSFIYSLEQIVAG